MEALDTSQQNHWSGRLNIYESISSTQFSVIGKENTMEYFNDDGTKIEPDLVPKPSLCLTCKKDDSSSEEPMCILNRNDQIDEPDFKCGAYEPK